MSVVSSLTDELGGFVGSLVDEALEGFLHGVDEAVVPLEAALRHVVHLVLEVQQLWTISLSFSGELTISPPSSAGGTVISSDNWDTVISFTTNLNNFLLRFFNISIVFLFYF